MKIKTAEFLVSNTEIKKLPSPDKHEFAFIGRSNVGKSSLINMLVDNKKLAKTSSVPGKTRLINHFIVNDEWYLVDLPGYGYAKISKSERLKWEKFINEYIFSRKNLTNLFVLIDIRHKPLQTDVDFINKLGLKQIPFVIVFTKTDKLSKSELTKNIENYKSKLLEFWENIPLMYITSSVTKKGKEDILDYIEKSIEDVKI